MALGRARNQLLPSQRDHRCSSPHKLASLVATPDTDHLKGNITLSRKSPGLSYPVNHSDQSSWPEWGAGPYNPDTSRAQPKSWGAFLGLGDGHRERPVGGQSLLPKSQLASWHCPACPMSICPAQGHISPRTQPREFLSPGTSSGL